MSRYNSPCRMGENKLSRAIFMTICDDLPNFENQTLGHTTVIYVISYRRFCTGVERSKMVASQTGDFVSSLSFVKISIIFNARGQSQTLSRSEKIRVYDCDIAIT